MTRLRKTMLEELECRNYSAGTTRRYLRFVDHRATRVHRPQPSRPPLSPHFGSRLSVGLSQKQCPLYAKAHERNQGQKDRSRQNVMFVHRSALMLQRAPQGTTSMAAVELWPSGGSLKAGGGGGGAT